jgi:hypothetical protein
MKKPIGKVVEQNDVTNRLPLSIEMIHTCILHLLVVKHHLHDHVDTFTL